MDCFASLAMTCTALRPHCVIASREAARQSGKTPLRHCNSWIASLCPRNKSNDEI
ncbi:MAG: hypothetical protein LBE71_04485 [Dysgonamonadaceae bacterium]|nr:hypothetical protein [Dysgonamonadaceae bacterium]